MGHRCPWDWDGQPVHSQPSSPAVSGGCCPPRGLWSGCWRPAWCGNLRKTSCARTGAGGRFCPRWQEGRDGSEDWHCKARLRGLDRGCVTTGSCASARVGLPSHGRCRSLPQRSYDNYLQIHLLAGIHGWALQDKRGSPCCRGGISPSKPHDAGAGVGVATASHGFFPLPPRLSW